MDLIFRYYVATMFSSTFYFNVLIIAFVNILASSSAYSSWIVISNIATSPPFGRHMCDQISLAPQQKRQCEKDPRTMASVRDGARLGIQECQFQFRNSRWNCSTFSKTTVINDQVIQREKPHLIVTVYHSGSQEASFVHAITSAGVTYAVTQACSRGDLEGCSCDKRKRGRSGNDSFVWGGCSDDIKYGMKFAENFIDACEMGQLDARANMNRHNNKVGRRAVNKFIRRKCKCHGPTTSCPTRTCWDELEDFRMTGRYLKAQYDRAARVTVRQDGSIIKLNSRRRGGPTNKKPGKEQLVFLEESPNYCVRNPATGSLGTGGRECKNTSKEKEGCKHLCCGRGYDTKRVTRVEQCHCKFHWCCQVICQNCSQELDIHTCKPETENNRGGNSISNDPANLPSERPSTDASSSTQNSQSKGKKIKGKGKRGKKKNRRREGRRRKKTKLQEKADLLRSKRDLYRDDFDLDEMMSSEVSSNILHGHETLGRSRSKSTNRRFESPQIHNIKTKHDKNKHQLFNRKKLLDKNTFAPNVSSKFSIWWKQFWKFVLGGT